MTYGEGWIPAAQTAQEMGDVQITENILTQGDPMLPSEGDTITQIGSLEVGKPVPEGWRVLTGGQYVSVVARVVLRYEIEKEGN